MLESKEYELYNHGIKKLVKSQKEAIDVNYIICDCSNEQNKKLILSFGVTESMQDFLLNGQLDGNIEGCDGKFHAGIYRRAKQIPLDYFIDKIINEDYQIVLTGCGFGASVAALVAVRILFNKEIVKEKTRKENILFIGFASPAFADLGFKYFIQKDYII